jgi:hypothetical protein
MLWGEEVIVRFVDIDGIVDNHLLYLTIIEPIYQYDISLHNYIMAFLLLFWRNVSLK